MGRGKRERRRAAEHGPSAVTTPAPTPGPRPHRWAGLLVIGVVGAVLAIATGVWWWLAGAPLQGPPRPAARYVGQPVCGQCHQQAEQGWRGSHHELAMQPPAKHALWNMSSCTPSRPSL